jgi:hypothetical protein
MAHFVFPRLRCLILVLSALALSACAGYDGSDLTPGESTLADIVESMGVPVMRWKDADGRKQLAYPRGPAATQTFMVFVGVDARLEKIEKVLNMEHFARIENGKSDMASVLRLLGPVWPPNDTYFAARDERVLSWLFCDSWNQQAYFDVLFDATTGIVRTTQQRPNYMGRDGVAPSCGH